MRATLKFNKNQVLEIENKTSLSELIDLVSDSYTADEWESNMFFQDKSYNFQGGYGNWQDANKKATIKEWLSIYRHSKEYGNWEVNTRTLSETSFGNVLDFGAGVGEPWKISSINENTHLYLLEANLKMASELEETYKSLNNVTIVTSLQDIKHLKFSLIYSNDVLEHVRYVNEHLDIFWHLGDTNCLNHHIIDYGLAEGHVLNLHQDTIINKFWENYIL